jgi:3-oxoacyl-[acyl-carrier-protein] synthase-3
MIVAKVAGTGLYAPGEPIDNEAVKRLAGVDFDSEKLANKIGIKARHIARLSNLKESTADFAEKAARAALAKAGVDPMEVGMFLVASDTPEFISPATGIVLQGRLQGSEQEARAFDVGSSCASFVTALDMAARAVVSDPTLRYALVVGVYNMPAYIKDGDGFGWSMFADGAGAMLLERDENGKPGTGYIEGVSRSDGTQWNYIGVYTGGTKTPVTKEVLNSGQYGFQLLQPLPGDRNVKLWPPLVLRVLEKAGVAQSEVSHYFFTQINKSVIEKVMGILGEPMEKTTTVMDRYGYTGSACVPMALHTAIEEGRVKKGDLIVLVASGAGLSVGANLLRL